MVNTICSYSFNCYFDVWLIISCAFLLLRQMAKVESDPKGNLWRENEGLRIQLKAPMNHLVMQLPVGEYCAALMLLHQ